MSRAPKHIYFLKPADARGPVKIGLSTQPVSRLKSYQIWSPVMLEMAAACEAHPNTEQFLHRRFIASWLHGEWFEWSKDLQAIIDYVNEHGRVPDWVERETPVGWRAYRAFERQYPRGKTKQALRALPDSPESAAA